MRIAVIGPGSMGLLYGGKLSAAADVILVGNNPEHLKEIETNGVIIRRGEEEMRYSVPVLLSGEEPKGDCPDLIILFTKAYQTRDALQKNRKLIGDNTILLTLQNGVGHEEVMRDFVSEERIRIGTTAQGSSRADAHTVLHSGLGDTVIGALVPESDVVREQSERIKEVMEASGFPCMVTDNIRRTVWNKLMINASSSALSGVLGVRQGLVLEDPDAWEICKDLIREICRTANAEGCDFREEEQIERLKNHLTNAPNGYTSIYSDLKYCRKTEADCITGAVVAAAKRHALEVPVQQTVLRLIHAMEEKNEMNP